MLSLLSLENLENGVVFAIDMCEIYSDTIFLSEWSDFKETIFENPEHTLNCFKLAIHQVHFINHLIKQYAMFILKISD